VITPNGKTVRAKVLTNTSDQSIGVQEGVQKARQILKDEYGFEGKFDYIVGLTMFNIPLNSYLIMN
jgi:5-oxoprolinase (ATP-hydrolysing)